MRFALLGIVVLIMGTAIGVTVEHLRMSPALSNAVRAQTEMQERLEKIQVMAGDLKESFEKLKAENASLSAQLTGSSAGASTQPEGKPGASADDAGKSLLADLLSEPGSAKGGAPEKARRADGPPQGNDAEKEEEAPRTDPMRLETASRSPEAHQEARERITEFFQQELSRAQDPQSQQRIASIQDTLASLIETRDALRTTQDPEARRQLREQSTQQANELQGMLTEQQDQILRDIANRYDITDPQRQNAFLSSLRGAESSPFFQYEQLMRLTVPRAPRPQP